MGAVIGVFSYSGKFSAAVAPLVSGRIKDTTGSLQGALYLPAGWVVVGMLFVALATESHPLLPGGAAYPPPKKPWPAKPSEGVGKALLD